MLNLYIKAYSSFPRLQVKKKADKKKLSLTGPALEEVASIARHWQNRKRLKRHLKYPWEITVINIINLQQKLPFVYDQRLKKIALVLWSRHKLKTLRQDTQLRHCSVKAWKMSSSISARLKIKSSRSHFDNLRSLPTLLSLFFPPLFSPQTRSRDSIIHSSYVQIRQYAMNSHRSIVTNLQSFLSLLQWVVSRSQFPTATLSANEIEYLLQGPDYPSDQ